MLLQGAVRPATIVTLGALALSPLYNWLMIFHMGLGLDGAVLAVNAVQVSQAMHAWERFGGSRTEQYSHIKMAGRVPSFCRVVCGPGRRIMPTILVTPSC